MVPGTPLTIREVFTNFFFLRLCCDELHGSQSHIRTLSGFLLHQIPAIRLYLSNIPLHYMDILSIMQKVQILNLT